LHTGVREKFGVSKKICHALACKELIDGRRLAASKIDFYIVSSLIERHLVPQLSHESRISKIYKKRCQVAFNRLLCTSPITLPPTLSLVTHYHVVCSRDSLP